MKRLSFLTVLIVLFAATTFAGEKYAKKCSADAQTCLNKMTAKMSQASWDGIWVHGIEEGKAVVVRKVDEESAGAKAGVREGDVLVAMNDLKLADLDPKAFYKAMSSVKIGEEVTYKIKRGEEWIKANVAMTAMPKDQAAKQIGWHMMTGHAAEGEKVAVN